MKSLAIMSFFLDFPDCNQGFDYMTFMPIFLFLFLFQFTLRET